MDQGVELRRADRARAVERLCDFIVRSIDGARAVEAPFYHLELERVFPDDVYASMLAAMPQALDYRPLYGQNQCNVLADGTPTRVKIDLFPEYIRHLPPEKRVVWDIIGRALCSEPVKAAFVRRLAPALARRFGPDYAKVGMYPIGILTRDVPGYKIDPHTDTRWKGITVQLFLPHDASHPDIGTIFHEKLPDGSLPKRTQMKFVPNSGYAFAVGEDTCIPPTASVRKSRHATVSCTPISSMPDCYACCAIAANGSATFCATSSATTRRAEIASPLPSPGSWCTASRLMRPSRHSPWPSYRAARPCG